MKILLSSLLFIPGLLIAQARVISLSSADSTEKVIYLGVDNYFKIVGYHRPGKTLSVTISQGNIWKEGNDKYLISSSVNSPDTLKGFEGNKLILGEIFQVKPVPDPVARLSNLQDTVATVSQILVNPFLSVYFPNCNFNRGPSVISFSAVFANSTLDTIAVNRASGHVLTGEQIQIIKKLERNDRISFLDIRAVGPDGRTRKLPAFTILIK